MREIASKMQGNLFPETFVVWLFPTFVKISIEIILLEFMCGDSSDAATQEMQEF